MKRLILTALLGLLSVCAFSQNRGPRPQPRPRPVNPALAKVADSFSLDSLVTDGFTLHYGKKQYAAEGKEEKPVLFLYLHGGGGRDSKGTRHIRHAAFLALDTYLNEHNLNAVVVAPVCPRGMTWERMGDILYPLLDSLVMEYGADPRRIYLMGTSFGAQGGWGLLSRRTGVFAAAQLASAAPKRYNLENVVKTPIFFTLGENDIDDPEKYAPVIESFKKNGAEIVFTVLPGLTHVEACNAAYTPESIEFLLRHVL